MLSQNREEAKEEYIYAARENIMWELCKAVFHQYLSINRGRGVSYLSESCSSSPYVTSNNR